MPECTVLFSFFLKLFFLVLAGALAIFLCFGRRLLLVGDGAAPRALAGPGVSMGALPPYRQATAVPQTTIGTHLDVALDIHRDFLAQIAFHRAFLFQDLANPVDLVFIEVRHLLVKIDAGAIQQRPRTAAPDSVNIGEPDLGSFLGRQIDASYTCHIPSLILAVVCASDSCR